MKLSKRLLALCAAGLLFTSALAACQPVNPPVTASQPAPTAAQANPTAMALPSMPTAAATVEVVDPYPLTGTLVYQSRGETDSHIFTIDLAEGRRAQLTQTGDNIEPAWSPDGTQIAYGCRAEGEENHQICLMNADGSASRAITTGPADKWGPDWSPDGKQIVFVSNEPQYAHLYIMDAAGSEPRRLLPEAKGNEGAPRFSPDGQWIAFMSDREYFALYRVHPDGTGEERLSPGPYDDRPAWSPDGSQIVFRRLARNSSLFNGNEIIMIDADGKNETLLTDDYIGNDWPIFSPDGKWLMYTDELNATMFLKAMPVEGGKSAPVVAGGLPGSAPDWKP